MARNRPDRSRPSTKNAAARNRLAELAWPLFLISLVGGIAFAIYRFEENERLMRENTPDGPRVVLAAMPIGEAMRRCRALWVANRYDQRPLALSWQKDRVDWYVESGTDPYSLRHYTCDGNEVKGGARYEHPLRKHMPPQPEAPRSILEDINLFAHYSTAAVGADLIAVEAMLHPKNQALVERRWTGPQAVAVNGPNAADMAPLFRERPAAFPKAFQPGAPIGGRTNWLREPERAFALLQEAFPPGTKFAEMDLREDSFKVLVAGPVKAFDGKPPAPFGEASFDEYGVRDASWLYPREQVGASCAPGVELREMAARFFEDRHARNPQMWSAQFDCQGDPAGEGEWKLRVPRRRR